MSKTITFP